MMEVKIEKVGALGKCVICEEPYIEGDGAYLETVDYHYHKDCATLRWVQESLR